MPDPVDLPERLADIRRDAGYSQEALARIIGRSVQEISRWERGVRSPSIESRRRLIRTLGPSAADLLFAVGGDDDEVAA